MKKISPQAVRAEKESKTTKDKDLARSVAKVGLPPGISTAQAKDPGSASGGKGFKNNS